MAQSADRAGKRKNCPDKKEKRGQFSLSASAALAVCGHLRSGKFPCLQVCFRGLQAFSSLWQSVDFVNKPVDGGTFSLTGAASQIFNLSLGKTAESSEFCASCHPLQFLLARCATQEKNCEALLPIFKLSKPAGLANLKIHRVFSLSPEMVLSIFLTSGSPALCGRFLHIASVHPAN